MPVFTYTAYDKKKKLIKGFIDANNLQGARTKLKAKGLYVKSIQEDTEKKDRELFPFLSNILYRVPRKEVGLFARQLGTLLGAGISLDKSLSNIIEQVQNPNFKKVIIGIKTSITEGNTLSQALAKHPEIFPSQYPSLISVGEKTGEYESTLIRLAELEDKATELKSKVQLAMIYPMIMGSLSLFVAVFLLTVVIPQIQELFSQFNQKLPFITRMVIGTSQVLIGYWLWLIIGFGLSIYGFIRFKNSVEGKKKWDTFRLKIPLTGNLHKKVLISTFSRNLGVLLSNKVSLITSLVIVGQISDNYVFETEVSKAIEKIKEGGKLSDSFQDSKILSTMVLGMLSAGEVSDSVPKMLLKLADIFDEEVNNTVKSLTQSLEPIMIIIMGGLIFTILLSIMLPMYSLTQEIRNL